MEWTIIIVLLVFAILFLLISLFLKNRTNDAETEALDQQILDQNREIYQLKRHIQELEDEKRELAKEKVDIPVESNSEEHSNPSTEDYDRYADYDDDDHQYDYSYNERPASSPMHGLTKQHIVTLYNQGETLDDIAEQLNVPVTTVQLVVDNYLEERSLS